MRPVLLFIILGVFWMPVRTQEPYFVDATLSNTMPFVGQQTVYRFRVYTLVDLGGSTYYLPPEFESLWRTEMGEQQMQELINGQLYSVIEVKTALFPTYEGTFTIEPAGFAIPATVFEDEQRLSTQPITLEALPLPPDSETGFSGAVGTFTMTATLDRQSITLGEPLTLRLTISGTGNVEQLLAPALPVPNDWGVYINPTTYQSRIENELLVGEKTFEWLITPSEAGQQTLPPITLRYFDLGLLEYRTLTAAAVSIDVLPGTPAPTTVALAPDAVDPAVLLAAKPIPTSLQVGLNMPGMMFWLLGLIAPAAALGVWVWTRQRRVNQRTQRQRQASSALQNAQARLQAASRMQPDSSYRAVSEAVYTYFGDKLQRSPASLSQADLRNAMEAQLVPQSASDAVLTSLEWADSGRYAPAGATDLQTGIERALKALAAVDAGWK
jgi:type II secretory pathway pseudopilin PulG